MRVVCLQPCAGVEIVCASSDLAVPYLEVVAPDRFVMHNSDDHRLASGMDCWVLHLNRLSES